MQPTASDQQQHFVALIDYVSVATRPVISVTFTDDPILARATKIKAVHITELRAAIDTLRAEVGLGPAAWTDSSLTRRAIKAIHVQELRDNLKPALTTAGRAVPTYTDDPLTRGAKIKKAHIDELRQAVR